jgi:hypothetical protein
VEISYSIFASTWRKYPGFLKRSKAELESGRFKDASLDQRIRSCYPPEALLRVPFPVRRNKTIYLANSELTHVDRVCAEKMMTSTSIPAEDSWHAMFLVDASLYMDKTARHVEWGAFRPRRVINNVTIPDLSNHIYSLSYRRSLSTQRSKLCYLLSKVLNEKCQARKFSSVFLDCYEPKHNIAKYIKSIVLCGLLGAYPTSDPSTRPCADVRRKLYDLISNCNYQQQQPAQLPPLTGGATQPRRKTQAKPIKCCSVCMADHAHGGPQAENWFLFLLSAGGIVVLYCIREYIHFMLQSNPCLLGRIRKKINFDKTLPMTVEAMNEIRKYFNSNLVNPFSDMYKFTDDVMSGKRVFNPNDIAESPPPTSWFYQLSCLMYPFQRNMLSISHQRLNKTMQESLLTACTKLNMVPLESRIKDLGQHPGVDNNNNSIHVPLGSSNEQKDDSTMVSSAVDDIVMQQMHINLDPRWSKTTQEKNTEQLEGYDSVIKEHRKMIGLCLTPKQEEAIRTILEYTMKNESTDSIYNISKFLCVFGVAKETKQFISRVITKRKGNEISDEKLRKCLVILRERSPHAYNILQSAAYLSHNFVSFSVICTLPAYIIKNQVLAIQSRFGSYMTESKYVPETACCMYYCSICHTVYSIVRDFVYGSKQSYEYGTLHASVDHKTGYMYCRNKFRDTKGSCESTPLTCINILGLFMRIKDQSILLCPQDMCGVPMVYSNQCMWTERGPCCSKCTIKKSTDVSVKISTASSLLGWHFDKLDSFSFPTCAICDCVLGGLGKMFWYPHSIIVCCFHTSQSIHNKFRQMYIEGEMDRDQTLELLNYLLMERRAMIQQRRRSRDQRLREQEKKRYRDGLGVSVEPDEKRVKIEHVSSNI